MGLPQEQSGSKFGMKMLGQLYSKEPSKNHVFSPFSAETAIAMTALGARGATEKQMLALIGNRKEAIQQLIASTPMNDGARGDGLSLHIANSIWINDRLTVKQLFVDQNSKLYQANVERADFSLPETLSRINGWVNEKTAGRIPTILDRIARDDEMFLLNSLYFKARWFSPFDESMTKPGNFEDSEGNKISVPMMHQDYAEFGLRETKQYRTAELGYALSRFTMRIYLPSNGNSIKDVIDLVGDIDYRSESASYRHGRAKLQLPRWKSEASYLLNEPLKRLGMTDAFDGSKADFSGMSEQRLTITKVIQKTFISVDEKGTEAAAATAIGMSRSIPPKIPDFVVDRPFVFVIGDTKTGCVLFAGVISDPSK